MTRIYAWLAGLGALIVGVLAALGMAKRAGKKEEQAAQTERALEQAKESNEIDTKVRSMSDAELDAKLRSVRPPQK